LNFDIEKQTQFNNNQKLIITISLFNSKKSLATMSLEKITLL